MSLLEHVRRAMRTCVYLLMVLNESNSVVKVGGIADSIVK